jgi:hypothetical protein
MTEPVIHVTGLKEAQKALYSYSQQMGDRVVMMALRTGANYMKRVVQATVPVKTGKLRRGFRVARSRIYNGRGNAEMIGVYLSLRKGKDAPFYGRFINDGWNTHGKKSADKGGRAAIRAVFGSRTGRRTLPGKTNVPGQQFVQKAYIAARNVAAEIIVSNAIAGGEAVKRRVGLK